ncbi:MAG: outer membrane beta-barrel protein [Flavitalea sp.]
MKRILTLLTGITMGLSAMAQSDSTEKNKPDTIKIGSMVIIRNQGEESGGRNQRVHIRTRARNYKPSAITTNWLILDLGFANYSDNTDYGATAASGFTGPGVNEDVMKLRTGKSINVNLWLFMQRLNMVKNVVNLKYGLGLELNNYRYRRPVVYEIDPTRVVLDNSTNYSKNKLAADYITVPMMLNFNFTPKRKNGFGLSVGASAGYLYNSRQKTITDAKGKNKLHDDFDLNRWKLSYIGELQLGPINLYGSLASESMFKKGFDQTPYTVGIRFSNLH